MKRKLTVILFAFGVKGIFAQDAVFSLPGASTAYANAALVDYNTVATFKSAYRLQWPKLDGGWSQYYGEYSQYIHSLHGHFTAYGLYENNYAMVKQTYFFNYTQDIKVSKHVILRAFFGAGYFTRKIDWRVLTFGDMIDPQRGFVYGTNDVPRGGTAGNADVNAGIGAKINCVTVGLGISHLTQPDQSVIKGKSPLPMHFSAQLGINYAFPVNRQFTLRTLPFFRFDQQGQVITFQYGSVFDIKGVRFGVAARKKDALNFLAGYDHKYFAINFAYDYTLGQFAGLTGGSFETMLVIKMGSNIRDKQKMKFDSPFLY